MKMGIKMVCFDLDKTLTTNSWLNINQAMGMTAEEDQYLFDLYEAKKLSYVDWQKELEKLYIGRGKATKESILKVINSGSYLPGAKEVVKYLIDKGYTVCLMSGSIDILVEKVAKELGIPYFSANNIFITDKNNYLTELKCLGEDTEVKVKQLTEMSEKLNINLNEIACVGDGDNDEKIFELTGRGITFEGSKIESKAWKVVKNLLEIKEIL